MGKELIALAQGLQITGVLKEQNVTTEIKYETSMKYEEGT